MRPTLLALIASLGIVLATPPSSAAADDDHIDTIATSTYQALPDKGYVRVAVTQSITNRIPDTQSPYACMEYFYDPYFGYTPYSSTCWRTTNYFVNYAWLWVEAGATQLKVTANGEAVTLAKSTSTTALRSYKVTFPEIFNGQTRTITATYIIPGGTPRSADQVRINKAYLNFWAISQPTDASSVRVEIPKAYDSTTWGGDVSEKTTAQTRVYTSGAIDPATFYVGVSGTNPAGFTTERVPTSNGRAISIEGWPGDRAWTSAIKGEAHDK